MGTRTKNEPDTLTTIYYSPKKEKIILIFKRDDSIMITADLEKTRLVFFELELQKHLIEQEYQLIGAFYEN